MLPFTSLDAVSSAGAGVARDLEGNFLDHTMSTHADGGGGPSASVVLEGSHDGTVWFPLASAVSAGGSNPTVVRASQVVRYVRANMTSWSAGDPATTVTATIASS